MISKLSLIVLSCLLPTMLSAQSMPSSAPSHHLVLSTDIPQSLDPQSTQSQQWYLRGTLSASAGFILGFCTLGAIFAVNDIDNNRGFDPIFGGNTTPDLIRAIALARTLGAVTDAAFAFSLFSFGYGRHLNKTAQLSASPGGAALSIRF
jgi:hypothetical protein